MCSVCVRVCLVRVWLCVSCACARVCVRVWFYLLPSPQPAVYHGVVGAQGGAGRLSLELSLVGTRACIPGETTVRVRTITLNRHRNKEDSEGKVS